MVKDKLEDFKKFIDDKCLGAKPLLIVIRGSHAYGTNIETSDIDYSGVYIQSMDDIIGTKYKEQINDDKNDTVFYEIRRFLELTASNNPTILELLNSPTECIIYKHPLFDIILNNRDSFITKTCAKSFGGYAIQQIKKAKGQDKKQNWEKERITRKSPIDFCYIHFGEKSISLVEWLKENHMDQKFCGLSKVPHSRDTYALFYDKTASSMFSIFIPAKKRISAKKIHNLMSLFGKSKLMGFKGISFEDSNDIRLSSIPLDCPKKYFKGHISYNKDGYTTHCNDYNSYQIWLKNKNEQRWIDVKSHNQKIDGKNLMHCRRLLTMAKEIAQGKGIIVKRPDVDVLLSIRRGEVDLKTLIDVSENDISEMDILFKESKLPDNVDIQLVNNILLNIRKNFYKI